MPFEDPMCVTMTLVAFFMLASMSKILFLLFLFCSIIKNNTFLLMLSCDWPDKYGSNMFTPVPDFCLTGLFLCYSWLILSKIGVSYFLSPDKSLSSSLLFYLDSFMSSMIILSCFYLSIKLSSNNEFLSSDFDLMVSISFT